MWAYAEALRWLYARQGLGIKLGLEKVERMLEELGSPHRQFESIHIAGTNGKGTVTHLLEDVLCRSGYKVGATTSPHLIHFAERIRINGQPVSQDALAGGLARVKEVVDAFSRDEAPTFFECVTALAFLLFAEAGVEWAVVETGLGGRLDATNVLSPRLTVITNVARDHEAMLGRHVGDIAFEKAGIMKPGVPCVTGASGDALHVLKMVSHRTQVPMSILDEDYHIRPDVNGMQILTPRGTANYAVGLAGEHMLRNAALVVAATDALQEQGMELNGPALPLALAEARMPGRLESFQREPGTLGADTPQSLDSVEVLLDGAHNEDAAHALRRHLAHRDWAGFDLVVGFHADKPWTEMLNQWAPLAARVWGAPLGNARSLDPADLASLMAGLGIPYTACASVPDALQEAVASAHARGDRKVLVAGSLFLVGAARAVLTNQTMEVVGDQ